VEHRLHGVHDYTTGVDEVEADLFDALAVEVRGEQR